MFSPIEKLVFFISFLILWEVFFSEKETPVPIQQTPISETKPTTDSF